MESDTQHNFWQSLIIKNRHGINVLIHLVQVVVANYLAFVIRFDSVIQSFDLNLFFTALPILLALRLVLYLQASLHKGVWSYSGIHDMMRIVRTITLGSIAFFISIRYIAGIAAYPLSIFILDWLLLIIITCATRLCIRVMREYLHTPPEGKRLLVVGAGDAGESIVRDMKSSMGSRYQPIGFIDENPYKKGLMIHGVPIFGPISIIPYVIETKKPEEILITLSSTNNDNIRKIYELCKPYNISIKKLPGINDLLSGNVGVITKLGHQLIEANLVTDEKVQEALALQKKEGGRLGAKLVKLGHISEETLASFLVKRFGISHVKPISLEDLLKREPIRTNIESVKQFIENKSVLVTGAGGSIGSELCRQIMEYHPDALILFDRYENGLFKIDLELTCGSNGRNGASHRSIISAIGDIADSTTLEYLFSKYRPQVIFHAAAHKHVPLMEGNPVEAIKNNVFGTKRLIDTAVRHDVENFVMISTDKAVNPTSMMGVTKRIAELLTMSTNSTSSTKFTTVRFGNVLGSNGSVITIFKEQLKNGGPLTVTHPEIKRFFMLIPEAVQLVLLAASYGKGGEIFVLDMGDQIKISELAENLIRLSGFIPDKEIKVVYTGLRPGEKMYEELFDESETIIPTFNEKIRVAVPAQPQHCDLDSCIEELERIVLTHSFNEIVPTIQRIVPNYRGAEFDKTTTAATRNT